MELFALYITNCILLISTKCSNLQERNLWIGDANNFSGIRANKNHRHSLQSGHEILEHEERFSRDNGEILDTRRRETRQLGRVGDLENFRR